MELKYQLVSLSISSSSNIKPGVPYFTGPIISSVARTRRGVTSYPAPKCVTDTKVSDGNNIARRSANYQPPIWHFDYVQSLRSPFTGEPYARQAEKLKEEVRVMVKKAEDDPLSLLEHIDILQRLGLSYHFENEVKGILQEIYDNYHSNDVWKKNNIYATALEFRLLRQHGYWVPQDIFSSIKDETGNFGALMNDDIKGMLSLYEASFHLVEGENILEEARNFTTKSLEEYIKRNKSDQNDSLSQLVSHALELPLHWRMLRLETRWFIDVYEKRDDMNPSLLELAKLDFNMVQSTHQEDLKHVSRWWRSTGLGQKLEFARDRLMENFLWTVGFAFEPHFEYCRRMSTKVKALLTVIDDIYDVYGTLDELELFTDAVERWDIDAMDQLPDYMKICFLALHNSINDMAFDVLKEQGLHIIKYLKKEWADICKSYLREAKWYYNGYTPTLKEYIDNAWISISAPVILVHAYFFVVNPIKEEALHCLEEYPSIIRQSSILFRLADDLATSSDELKRGDVPKSIQCYMHEAGVSEDEARRHIKLLIDETWKHLNEDRVADSRFPKAFIEIATNLSRMAQCMYQYGDGHGIQDRETKDRVLSLLVNPIPLS
ncbi:Squalene/phytoene synthase [Parasponia andersonii]|uniref:Squalene/phytoene synthase n=1 Tax=Parasponia andersonii TaxID=3476 RepID=A0A2P5ALJ0_PARAD|nr:Squalene/phytoene synthase [Parasponia andersonii]